MCAHRQLAISPNPRTADEPIIVHYDTRLTLKVEGIVQVSSHVKRFHHVQSVELLVHSTQQSRSPTLNGENTAVFSEVLLTPNILSSSSVSSALGVNGLSLSVRCPCSISIIASLVFNNNNNKSHWRHWAQSMTRQLISCRRDQRVPVSLPAAFVTICFNAILLHNSFVDRDNQDL